MRIISAAPSNTEILYALTAEKEIVAVTSFCNYPIQARSKPKIGGWTTANLEQIKKFQPDLVITSTFLQDKIAENLKKDGIKVLHINPKTLKDVFKSILVIGKEIGKEKKARILTKKMIVEFNKFRVNRKRKIRIYIEEWHQPPMVSGNWVPKLIELAGGKALINEGDISRNVIDDEIKKFNPEIIILSLCGFGLRPSPDLIYRRKNWHALDAVINKKVFVFDDDLLNRPGPRLVLGFKNLVQTVRGENIPMKA